MISSFTTDEIVNKITALPAIFKSTISKLKNIFTFHKLLYETLRQIHFKVNKIKKNYKKFFLNNTRKLKFQLPTL